MPGGDGVDMLPRQEGLLASACLPRDSAFVALDNFDAGFVSTSRLAIQPVHGEFLNHAATGV